MYAAMGTSGAVQRLPDRQRRAFDGTVALTEFALLRKSRKPAEEAETRDVGVAAPWTSATPPPPRSPGCIRTLN